MKIIANWEAIIYFTRMRDEGEATLPRKTKPCFQFLYYCSITVQTVYLMICVVKVRLLVLYKKL